MSVNPLPDFLKFIIAPEKTRAVFSERAHIDALGTLRIKKRTLKDFKAEAFDNEQDGWVCMTTRRPSVKSD
jgi:hypothetical protein